MMMTGTAYPWDLDGDAAFATRARDIGVSRLTIAAAYHGVRAATPLHPAHRLVTAAHAAFYPAVREQAWRGSRLIPPAPGAWVRPGAFERAMDAVRRAGLEAAGWIVATHSSHLGRRHPNLTVTSAFGDVHAYALCPAHDDVVDYAVRLTAETVVLGGVDRLVVEACGPLGADHLGAHDKTAGADWGTGGLDLLSVCFCGACGAAYASAGADPLDLAARIRVAVDAPEATRSGLSAVDAATRDLVLGVRARAATRLQEAVVAAARSAGAGAVVLHATTRREATGPNVWLHPESAPSVAVQLSATEGRALGADGLARYRRERDTAVHVAENVAGGDAGTLRARLRDDVALGADELSVGHLGLVGSERWELLRSWAEGASEIASS